jgi:hypothetical protein
MLHARLLCCSARNVTAKRRAHLVSVVSEHDAAQPDDVRLVVDDENSHG